jgi:hypothetical protein
MKDLEKYKMFLKRLKVKVYVIKNNILDRLYNKFYTDPYVIWSMEDEAMTEKEKVARIERNLAWLDAQYVPQEIDEEHNIAKYSV